MPDELIEMLVDKLTEGLPPEAACAAVWARYRMQQLRDSSLNILGDFDPNVLSFVARASPRVSAPRLPTAECLGRHLPKGRRPSRSEIEYAISACLAENRGRSTDE